MRLPNRKLPFSQAIFTMAGIGASVAGVATYLAVWGRRYGLDLEVYRAGVGTWIAGQDPYLYVFTVHHLKYTYPPASLPLLVVLGAGPFTLVEVMLWAVSIAAVGVSSYVIAGSKGQIQLRTATLPIIWACVAAVVAEPFRATLDYGQVDAILLLVVIADLVVVPKRHRGWLLGLASAVKLTPLVFLLILILERDWRSVTRCLAAFVGSSVVVLCVWPSLSTRYWFHALWQVGRIGPIAFASNQSWNGVVHRALPAGFGTTSIWVALCLATVGVAAIVAVRSLQNAHRIPAVYAVALCGLLVSPISWSHEWVWVVIVPPLLLGVVGRQVPQSIVVMLWVLLGISIAAPYWWFGPGAIGDAAEALMPVWGAACLVVWAVAERRGSLADS